MKIQIQYKTKNNKFIINRTIKKVIKKALEIFGDDYDCNVYVTLCDDEYIKEINSEHRNKNTSTDVLSFPLINWSSPMEWDSLVMGEDVNPITNEVELGDIIISLDTAIIQSKEYNHSLNREIAYLCVHGLLHLLGHDHMEDEEKKVMRECEEKVLVALNITRY